ncbi:MAG: hypothetical protein IJ058_12470 [Lachnospiraceae bacterium]|nr:hypothetical protein [Lachnospiraceae bacterium]
MDNKIKSEFKKYTIILLSVGLGCVMLAAALTAYVDPFFHYHAPLEGFPYEIDNQLTQNPGMAKHFDYDSVILGSSMTVNFNTDLFADEMGLNTIKLSYSGAYPRDISNIERIIFDSHPDTKVVFLGIDVFTYSSATDETKFPLPEYLYDSNNINDISYLLNRDVLMDYIVRPAFDPDPTDLAHVYSSWWTDEYYNINYVMPAYMQEFRSRERIPGEQEKPRDYFKEAICDNMEENILPYIREHPDTRFVVFYPPYSILFWNDMIDDHRLEATLYEYELISEMLGAYDNVDIYFFADEEKIITDLNNYADYTHYHPRYNDYMTRCFATGVNRCRDGGDVMRHIENMRRIVDEYDFEALLKGW